MWAKSLGEFCCAGARGLERVGPLKPAPTFRQLSSPRPTPRPEKSKNPSGCPGCPSSALGLEWGPHLQSGELQPIINGTSFWPTALELPSQDYRAPNGYFRPANVPGSSTQMEASSLWRGKQTKNQPSVWETSREQHADATFLTLWILHSEPLRSIVFCGCPTPWPAVTTP